MEDLGMQRNLEDSYGELLHLIHQEDEVPDSSSLLMYAFSNIQDVLETRTEDLVASKLVKKGAWYDDTLRSIVFNILTHDGEYVFKAWDDPRGSDELHTLHWANEAHPIDQTMWDVQVRAPIFLDGAEESGRRGWVLMKDEGSARCDDISPDECLTVYDAYRTWISAFEPALPEISRGFALEETYKADYYHASRLAKWSLVARRYTDEGDATYLSPAALQIVDGSVQEVLDYYRRLPHMVISHGHFTPKELLRDPHQTSGYVLTDWAHVGRKPIGYDAAFVVWSAGITQALKAGVSLTSTIEKWHTFLLDACKTEVNKHGVIGLSPLELSRRALQERLLGTILADIPSWSSTFDVGELRAMAEEVAQQLQELSN